MVGLADLKRSQGKECKSAGLEFEQTSDVGMSAFKREKESEKCEETRKNQGSSLFIINHTYADIL